MAFFWHALLGLIQGLTEFLPVSSSGHLAAARMMIERWAPATAGPILSAPPLFLEVCLHVGTLATVIVIYRKDLWQILTGMDLAVRQTLSGKGMSAWNEDRWARLGLSVVAASVPTAILGFALKRPAERVGESLFSLGVAYVVLTAVLASTRWIRGGSASTDLRRALLVGLAQGIAVFPGISRSGLTISAGLAAGLDREEAARLSFLLSIPAVAGAALIKIREGYAEIGLNAVPGYVLGGLSAFLVGCAALYLLVRIVRAGRLWLFAPYTAIMGIVLISLG